MHRIFALSHFINSLQDLVIQSNHTYNLHLVQDPNKVLR